MLRKAAPEEELLDVFGRAQGGIGQGNDLVVPPGLVVGPERPELIPQHPPRQAQLPRPVVGAGRLVEAAQGGQVGAQVEPGERIIRLLRDLGLGSGQRRAPHGRVVQIIPHDLLDRGGPRLVVDEQIGAVEDGPVPGYLIVGQTDAGIRLALHQAVRVVGVIGDPLPRRIVEAHQQPVVAHAVVWLRLVPGFDQNRHPGGK